MSHIDSNKLLRRNLSNDEEKHLERCGVCQEDYQILRTLGQSNESAALFQPPEHVWEKIDKSRSKQSEQKGNRIVLRAFSIAASITVVVLVGLTWKTSVLEDDMKLLISKNRDLEIQISLMENISYRHAEYLEELKLVERNLALAKGDAQKKELLDQRVLALQSLIYLQEREKNEIFL